ncbi:MAG TPA: hypothetical protein VH619_10910 [Verrucomicrobiae bacterium]|jgi:hypothetical protein|nr:hypothetical protein [Verrucomicrobiae bacterium]
MEINRMQSVSTSQRRGKIARLPGNIREELNIRLDDGQEAGEILTWLNAVPEVREILANHFEGSPISPQNLSAWRHGGFQEWLFQTRFIESSFLMRESVDDLQREIDPPKPGKIPRTMADYMVSYLAFRFASFMGTWNGAPSPEHAALLKTATIILRLQAATRKIEPAAAVQPQPQSQPGPQSSPIKVAKGSPTPSVVHHVDFGHSNQKKTVPPALAQQCGR